MKYARKGSTYIPGTPYAILLRVLNHLEKITSQKPEINSKYVDYVYTNNDNDLRKAGLAPNMGALWRYQDEKIDSDKENDPDTDKKKNINVYFCVTYSRYFSMSIHRVIWRLKNHLIYLIQEHVIPTIDLLI